MLERNTGEDLYTRPNPWLAFDALTKAVMNNKLFSDTLLSKRGNPAALLGLMRHYVTWSFAMQAEEITHEGWVSLVHPANGRPTLEDCWRYYFPGEHPAETVRTITQNYKAVSSPEPGDYLVYFRDHTPAHIGRFSTHEQVVSKWGRGGPVFKHLPLITPFQYGNTLVCFRKPSGYNLL